MILTDELLLNYKRCSRRTYLDLHGNPKQRDAEKEFLLKLKRESQAHIKKVLLARSIVYQKPSVSRRNWSLNAQQTEIMMQQGVDCIYGSMLALTFADWQLSLPDNLLNPDLESTEKLQQSSNNQSIAGANNLILLASPTLLIKTAGNSKFGDWSYLPVNIKLGRRPKPEYKLIAAFHAQMLAVIQGSIPLKSQLILRQQDNYFVNLEYWLPKMQTTVANCVEMLTFGHGKQQLIYILV